MSSLTQHRTCAVVLLCATCDNFLYQRLQGRADARQTCRAGHSGRYAKAMAWLQKAYQHQPGLFAHWQLVAFTSGRAVGAG
jgi:hypothetical protein